MLRKIDLPRALLRGRYMAAVATMEHNGVPIDVATLALLRRQWTKIQDRLIAAIDCDYGVYDGRSFKTERFEALLARRGIPWPRLESGRLALDGDTFRQMAKAYPVVAPLHELRHALAELRLNDLAVGLDGRNRTLLSPFRCEDRTQSAEQFKVHHGPERLAARADQAAAGTRRRLHRLVATGIRHCGSTVGRPGDDAAYHSGDPYLDFAKQAGARPARRHQEDARPAARAAQGVRPRRSVRDGSRTRWRCGSGSQPIVARDLLRAHRETFPVFWRWT